MNIAGIHTELLAEKGIVAEELMAAAEAALQTSTPQFVHAGFQFAVGPTPNRVSYAVDLLDDYGGRQRVLNLMPDPPAWPRAAKSVLSDGFVDPKAYLPK